MNKNRFWLLLIILIGFGLRLTRLGEQSLWYDEGVTWLLAQMRTTADLIQWTAADIQPPLYYLLIWGSAILFGHSEAALRFPSTVFNILTIPVLVALARRLWPARRTLFSLLAAALFALSPLMVYYSQEARMYTLLVFEATLSSYLLLKLIHANQPAPPPTTSLLLTPYCLLPTFYALTAAAALYTHYFAAFLLTAHAVYLGPALWRRGRPRRLINQAVLMFGLTALLFAPWLPTLLARLGDDPSYWPGALKLHEAARQVLISFTLGETVFEQTGFRLAWGYLLILATAAIWTIARRQKFVGSSVECVQTPGVSETPGVSPTFLLLWLFLPILLILALSYRSPKFNPRYTLLAWPAFNLLLAAALTRLCPPRSAPRSPLSPLRSPLFTLALLFVLATSAFSLTNWFTDIRFSKDDFKALAQFVRERIAAGETVLLSSGHLFPVWAYYYGWDNWTPLPRLPRLDVNRVTDLSISTAIAQAVADKEGVWLVTWQDEVIDPNGVVPFWLDRIGWRPHDAGDFYGVGLEHWRFYPPRLERLHQDPIDRPAA
ncbi:MAG: glycosyltransferase family 39 protein, partial [Chloroflexota bacterium]